MEKYKTIVNVPGWSEYFTNGQQMQSASTSYSAVPLVYRCVRLISDALSSVELKVYKGEKEAQLPFEMDTSEWTWRMTASLLLTGGGYSVKLMSKSGKVLGLQWLNPTTVSVDVANGLPVFKRTGNIVSGSQNQWGLDEMLYVREFSLKDDYTPGVSAAEVALTDSGLIKYLTRFASYYFEQGAMPLTILSIDKQTLAGEQDKLQNYFRSVGTGVRNAWKALVIRGGKEMAPFTITPELTSMVMPELYDQARRSVCGAFGIPQTMLEDAANFATAKEHRLSFWQDTVRPRGNQLASALNSQVLSKFGLRCEYAFDELDIFQEDEASRAGSLYQLTNAGVPLLVAMDILGYDMDDQQKEVIRLSQVEAPAVRDESDEQHPEEAPVPTQSEVRSALFNWKRAALAAVKSGHQASVDFDHPAIPYNIAERVHRALEICKSADEVHELFKQAREWVKQEANEDIKAMPDGLVAELKRANDLLEMDMRGGKMASVKVSADIPMINVKVEPPPAPVTVMEQDGPEKMTIQRDRSGRITGMTKE